MKNIHKAHDNKKFAKFLKDHDVSYTKARPPCHSPSLPSAFLSDFTFLSWSSLSLPPPPPPPSLLSLILLLSFARCRRRNLMDVSLRRLPLRMRRRSRRPKPSWPIKTMALIRLFVLFSFISLRFLLNLLFVLFFSSSDVFWVLSSLLR